VTRGDTNYTASKKRIYAEGLKKGYTEEPWRSPPPPNPYPVKTRNRLVWSRGYAQGRAIRARHADELRKAIEKALS
jgi:hypothetical protein